MMLNYRTLAFVMDVPMGQAKEVVKQILNQDKVTTQDTVPESAIVGRFGTTRSVDPRYDGQDKFLFYLEQRRASYRSYLNEKSCIKSIRFTGKFQVFYQLLTEEEIQFCHNVLKEKNKFIYGTKKNAAGS